MGETDPRSVRRLLGFACFSSYLVLVVSVLVLIGWTADIPHLTSVIIGRITMKPLTAVGFMLIAGSLGFNGAWWRVAQARFPRIARICALSAAFLGLLTILEYAVPFNAGIDNFLLKEVAESPAEHPGRMSPASAIGLVLLGLALLSLDGRSRGLLQFSQNCGLTAMLLGLLSSIGHLYRADAFTEAFTDVPIAVHSAFLFLVLGCAVLAVRPQRGMAAVIASAHLGGEAARRILPLAMGAPIVIGWLRLLGQRSGLYGTEFGIAIFATTTVLIFALIVWSSARSLNQMDAQRRKDSEAIRESAEELRTAYQRLSHSEERFQLFMDHFPSNAFLKDQNGRYVWGNRAWRQQFSTEAGEPLGKTDGELWPPEVRAVFQASDQKVLKENMPVQFVETSKVGSEVRHWMVSKFPVRAADGSRLIGGISFDTTERKRLEFQLYQSQKLEAIGLLAGGVAHDFNNLLTVILGFADEVRLAVQEGRSPDEDLNEIQRAAQKAADLTAQLLAFGRKQILRPQLVNLNDSVTETQRMLGRVLRENIQVQLSLAPDLAMVLVDPVQIHQVIINLAINAQDAMPDGGQIIIETANANLDEQYVVSHNQVVPGPFVQLSFTDTGNGMDEATKAHIFEPFFTTKAAGKGTGLGLATVYGIVKQSNGYIWVYSEPGQGTSFKIYFPSVTNSLSLADSEAPAGPAASAAGQTLLIAEDEESVRSIIVKACSKAGYHILSATNGEEALALAETHPGAIDLLITDVIMPGISGPVLADEVLKRRPEIRILYCSGYAENSMIDRGVLGGRGAFVQKPFSTNTLLQAIHRALTG
jgi:two-component system, cell cycle sensor histidine kinase and response regulator CckA